MSQSFDPIVSFIAGTAIANGQRVKLANTGKLAVAGAADVSIGTAFAPIASGESGAVRTKFGTAEVLVSGGTTADAVGDSLEAAAAGVLDKATSGTVVAVAMKAVTADAVVAEVVLV